MQRNSNSSGKKAKQPSKKKRLQKSRHDEHVRKLKKLPLCVTVDFLNYAEERGWDDKRTDEAAWIMHRFFMLERHSDRKQEESWIPFPYQEFEDMFHEEYRQIRGAFLAEGFLEYHKERGYKRGSHCSEFRLCKHLRDQDISASYYLKTRTYQDRYLATREDRPKSNKKRQEQAKQVQKIIFSR
jgi:hypothetical protein